MPERTHIARARLIHAVLRVIGSQMDGETDPRASSDAECQYADELLALAARDLAVAVDEGPVDRQPVGWRRPELPEDTTGFPWWEWRIDGTETGGNAGVRGLEDRDKAQAESARDVLRRLVDHGRFWDLLNTGEPFSVTLLPITAEYAAKGYR